MINLRLDPRNELNSARTGTDHRDPPTAEIDRLIPFRRVKGHPLERLEACNRRHRRPRELAHRRHQHVDLYRVTGAEADRPLSGDFVECRRGHLTTKADLPVHVVAVRDLLEIGQDRRLAGEAVRPARIGGEGVRVERRRHVARRLRIGVGSPHPTDLIALLENDDVAITRLLQYDDRSDTAESRADNCDARAAHRNILSPT